MESPSSSLTVKQKGALMRDGDLPPHSNSQTIGADGREDSGGDFAVSSGQLRSIIERIERLEEEKREVAEHIKEVFAEAKGNGFDVKTLRSVIALRKKDPEDRSQEQALLELYLQALGMPAS